MRNMWTPWVQTARSSATEYSASVSAQCALLPSIDNSTRSLKNVRWTLLRAFQAHWVTVYFALRKHNAFILHSFHLSITTTQVTTVNPDRLYFLSFNHSEKTDSQHSLWAMVHSFFTALIILYNKLNHRCNSWWKTGHLKRCPHWRL